MAAADTDGPVPANYAEVATGDHRNRWPSEVADKADGAIDAPSFPANPLAVGREAGKLAAAEASLRLPPDVRRAILTCSLSGIAAALDTMISSYTPMSLPETTVLAFVRRRIAEAPDSESLRRCVVIAACRLCNGEVREVPPFEEPDRDGSGRLRPWVQPRRTSGRAKARATLSDAEAAPPSGSALLTATAAELEAALRRMVAPLWGGKAIAAATERRHRATRPVGPAAPPTAEAAAAIAERERLGVALVGLGLRLLAEIVPMTVTRRGLLTAFRWRGGDKGVEHAEALAGAMRQRRRGGRAIAGLLEARDRLCRGPGPTTTAMTAVGRWSDRDTGDRYPCRRTSFTNHCTVLRTAGRIIETVPVGVVTALCHGRAGVEALIMALAAGRAARSDKAGAAEGEREAYLSARSALAVSLIRGVSRAPFVVGHFLAASGRFDEPAPAASDPSALPRLRTSASDLFPPHPTPTIDECAADCHFEWRSAVAILHSMHGVHDPAPAPAARGRNRAYTPADEAAAADGSAVGAVDDPRDDCCRCRRGRQERPESEGPFVEGAGCDCDEPVEERRGSGGGSAAGRRGGAGGDSPAERAERGDGGWCSWLFGPEKAGAGTGGAGALRSWTVAGEGASLQGMLDEATAWTSPLTSIGCAPLCRHVPGAGHLDAEASGSLWNSGHLPGAPVFRATNLGRRGFDMLDALRAREDVTRHRKDSGAARRAALLVWLAALGDGGSRLGSGPDDEVTRAWRPATTESDAESGSDAGDSGAESEPYSDDGFSRELLRPRPVLLPEGGTGESPGETTAEDCTEDAVAGEPIDKVCRAGRDAMETMAPEVLACRVTLVPKSPSPATGALEGTAGGSASGGVPGPAASDGAVSHGGAGPSPGARRRDPLTGRPPAACAKEPPAPPPPPACDENVRELAVLGVILLATAALVLAVIACVGGFDAPSAGKVFPDRSSHRLEDRAVSVHVETWESGALGTCPWRPELERRHQHELAAKDAANRALQNALNECRDVQVACDYPRYAEQRARREVKHAKKLHSKMCKALRKTARHLETMAKSSLVSVRKASLRVGRAGPGDSTSRHRDLGRIEAGREHISQLDEAGLDATMRLSEVCDNKMIEDCDDSGRGWASCMIRSQQQYEH